MEVNKKNIGMKVYCKKAGMLLKVTPENYELLKETHKHLYVTTAKKPTNKNSTNSTGESDS